MPFLLRPALFAVLASAKRSAMTPDLPAIAEAGYPGYEAIPWWGVMLPAKTPEPLVKRIHADVLK